MNKDIIYIDVEDDITAIIGKVKDAKQKIVALVPPKRIGVLQSTVNLRLLARAASQADKHLVVISSNPALVALAAAAQLPVAKNLQSKPEMAEISALDIDDGEDVIDGAQLPVGELARTAGVSTQQIVAVHNPAIDSAIADNASEALPKRALPPEAGKAAGKVRSKSGVKVPNFNTFRKRFLIIILAAVLLIGFLIWGIFFAPRATVLITARTSESSVNNAITFGEGLSTDLAAKTLASKMQQTKKTATTEFEATGSKDVGEKATGTVKFSTDSIGALGKTIPAGTVLSSSGGMTYVTNESVTMTISNSSGAPASITASERGTKSNGATGKMTGAPSGIDAALQGATTGGTDKTITIVTQADIQKATEQLKLTDTDAVKKELKNKLSTTAKIVDESFKVDQAAPVATPAVDQEVPEGVKPKLTTEATYSMSAIDADELASYLNEHFKKQLEGLDTQRIYENGIDTVTFTNVNAVESGFTANVVATAKIGPKIEDSVVKDSAKGKRYGEIQSSLEAIQGVDDVDVVFWPFWVSAAPNDTDKITVEFKLNEPK